MDGKFFIAYLKDMCQVAPNTVRTYGYSLAWLAKRIEGFLVREGEGRTVVEIPTPEQVIDYMDRNKVGETRRMLSYTAMKVWHKCHGEEAERKRYGAPLVDCKRCVDATYEKQQKSETETKNWVEQGCLKKYAAELRKRTYALDKNQLFTKDQYAELQLGFMLTYLLKYPVRRDLATVQWTVPDEDDKTTNYLDGAVREVVYQKYKTSKHHGTIKHKLSRDMWRLLALIRKQQKMRKLDDGPILLSRYWRAMSPNAFGMWMKREMKKCPGCEDKSVGCMAVRKSVITHKRRGCMSFQKRAAFAKECMHSARQQEFYRKF